MKIGSLELDGAVFVAPMAGITDPPFRRVVQEFGASALWTEMISSHAVVKAHKVLPTMNTANHKLPVIFQVVGKEPVIMAECARIVEGYGAAAIDINMGCPARKVVAAGGGAALMRDPDLVKHVVREVRNAVSIPLTIKMRAGWDEKKLNAPELAGIVEKEGADAIVVHGRSRRAAHSGPVSLELIRQVCETVSIPVIGNGGILNIETAVEMFRETGCQGIMVGRGVLGRPWFPEKILESIFGFPVYRSVTSVGSIVASHFEDQLSFSGDSKGLRSMRKHLGWYSRGFEGASEFRSRVFTEEDPKQVMVSINNFFGKVAVP
ncbi:MAG: tRNA dihydrouridine synthase DusB [Pseudomonadota bacterium]